MAELRANLFAEMQEVFRARAARHHQDQESEEATEAATTIPSSSSAMPSSSATILSAPTVQQQQQPEQSQHQEHHSHDHDRTQHPENLKGQLCGGLQVGTGLRQILCELRPVRVGSEITKDGNEKERGRR